MEVSSRFPSLFWRQTVRPLLRRPGLAILTLAGIALGVGVFLAIRMANSAALDSFRSAADLATGRAHLEIRGEIPEELFPRVARTTGVAAAAPLVEGLLPLPDSGGEFLRVLGVDLFRATDFYTFRLEEGDGSIVNFEDWLRYPSQIAVDQEWQNSFAPSGSFSALSPSGLKELGVIAKLVPETAGASAGGLGVMDIGWAQELLGYTGILTAIQVLLEDESEADVIAEEIRSWLPGDLRVEPPTGRNEDLLKMTSAFQLNLTAMSLVSIVVGMFLIFNSLRARVVQRQRDIAMLRSLGTTRTEVRLLFLGEAVMLGSIGALIGVLAAPVLATAAAQPIATTISSLYEVVRAGVPSLEPKDILLGLLAGAFAALAAAWLPANEAAALDPAKILHEGASLERFAPPYGLLMAAGWTLLLLAVSTSWLALQGAGPWLGFASAACVLGAFSCFVPAFARLAAWIGRPLGLLGRLAADTLNRSLHRSGVTIAALAAAVSMAVAVSVMIHSFRSSVERWVEHTLVADLYVAPAANEIIGLASFLPDGVAEWTKKAPEVATVATFRELPIDYQGRPVHIAVIEGGARGELNFLKNSARANEQIRQGKAVALSESLVNRSGDPGNKVVLPTPQGPIAFPVAGVYKDYTRDAGTILVPRTLFERYWTDSRLHSLSVMLKEDADPKHLVQRLRDKFPEGLLATYDNIDLRSRVYEIFDQTFAVTNALRGIAVLVAVIGIAFSTAVLVSERRRESAVLRALGASRGQVTGVFLGEALLVGLAACLTGLVGGLVLSMVLTWVVNLAFFGWSISLSFPWAQLAITPLWVLPAALAAGLIPSLRAATAPPAMAVRFE